MIDPLFFSQECSDARTCLRTGPVCMCGIEKMQERMRKLEAIAEVAKRDAGRDGAGVSWEMTETLKDLWREKP